MAGAARNALIEGLCDAAGFVLGALAGWWLGRMLGFDFVNSAGYGPREMVGLLFILVGCGLGRLLSQRVKAALLKDSDR
jgi:hypothetical protein